MTDEQLTGEQLTPEEARRAAIVRLLDTRHEHLPEPIRRTEASTGFAHTEPARVSCPDCLANDRPMFGCETCGGRGYTEEKRERDPYSISDKVAPYGFDGSRHDASRARDRQIEALGQQLRPAPSEAELLEEANRSPYAWERARARMYKLYDYAALDRALEQLHLAHPGLSPYSVPGLDFIDERMPAEIRVPEFSTAQSEVRVVGTVERTAGARAYSVRDAEIHRAVIDAKIPTSDVARAWGLSVRQVNNIVQQRSKAA